MCGKVTTFMIKHPRSRQYFLVQTQRPSALLGLLHFSGSRDVDAPEALERPDNLKLKRCALLMICSDSNCVKVND